MRSGIVSIVVWGVMNCGIVSGQQKSLPELAQAVAEQEAVFADCDFTIRHTHEQVVRSVAGDSTTRFVVETHTVTQGDQFRRDMVTRSVSPDGMERRYLSEWWFDGRATRRAEAGVSSRSVKVTEGPSEGQRVSRLHRATSLITEHGFVEGVPVSTLLQGLDAVRAACPDRDGSLYLEPEKEWEWEHLGTDTVEDLTCEHVRCSFRSHGMNASLVTDIWLAPDRNDFVARTEQGKPAYGEAPYATSRVTRWDQLPNGLWYPQTVEMVVLDSKALRQGQKPRVMRKEFLEVTVTSIAPEFEAAYFQDPELKPDAANLTSATSAVGL